MKVLLTGTPGWLGNRFLEVLSSGFNGSAPPHTWEIRCLVQEGIDSSFIDTLAKTAAIEKHTGDIARIDTLKNVAKDVDIVFHIAGIVHPKKIKELYQINSLGTENMLKVSVEAGVKRFIHISSNSVAGTNTHINKFMVEQDKPNPYLNYGISKYKAECAVNDYYQSGTIETVILRACWFYGPHQPERQTTFFKMIKKGNPIIFGDGKNLRSLSYIDNLCQAMLLAAENKNANGQTYWIADEKPYPTNEIYKTIAELLEVKYYKPIHVPHFISKTFHALDIVLQGFGIYIKEVHVAGEMNKNIACSIEKAQNELGYKPAIALKEGMYNSIAWCRKQGIMI